MGRFESTATIYAEYRQPYTPAFFAAVAERLRLDGSQSLIDLGTGPGLIALGLAPYASRILGVDPEPTMLAEARATAVEAGRDFPLLQARADELDPDRLGPFDLITIGRALHWMKRETTLPVLEQLLAPGGALLTLGARTVAGTANPWLEAYEVVRDAWSAPDEPGVRHDSDAFFVGSPFRAVDRIEVEDRHTVTPEALFQRLLTMSSSSPARLGDRIGECREAVMAALAPHFTDGVRDEITQAGATVYRREG